MCRKLLNGKMAGILVVFLALFMVAGIAEGEWMDASGQWVYAVEDGGATLTGCMKEPSGDLVIPDTLDGFPVTGIGNFAFYACSRITGVTIPGSVTSIGIRAFSDCAGLTGVTIPDSVTSIGNEAFYPLPWAVHDIGIIQARGWHCMLVQSPYQDAH